MSRRTAALGAAALASLLAAVLLCACESPLSGDESAAGSQENFLTVEDLVDQALDQQGQDGFYQKDGWLAKE